MRAKKARQLRAAARQFCNPLRNDMVWSRNAMRWPPTSYRWTYQKLKKQYRSGVPLPGNATQERRDGTT